MSQAREVIFHLLVDVSTEPTPLTNNLKPLTFKRMGPQNTHHVDAFLAN